MKGRLTASEVKASVRLFRANVDGASELLETLIRERGGELPALLGVTPHQVLSMAQHEDPASTLAVLVETAAASSIGSNTRARRSAAQMAAAALGKAAVLRDGRHHFPVALLRKVLDLWRGPGDIVFGDRAAVDIARLRALVRQCASLDSTMVTLSIDHLLINYSTTRARGMIRFLLRAPVAPDNTLHVPIPPVGSVTAGPLTAPEVIYVPAPWPADDGQRADSPPPVLPPRRPLLSLVRRR